jgi:hypothetical protein
MAGVELALFRTEQKTAEHHGKEPIQHLVSLNEKMNIPLSFLSGKKTTETAQELAATTASTKHEYMIIPSNNTTLHVSPKPQHMFQAPVPLSLPPTDITLRYIRERNWEAPLHRLAICPADA